MKLSDSVLTAIQQSNPRQLHRLGNILRFFAVLVILTMIARGTASVTMPLVTVQTAGSGSVTESILANGTIEYSGGVPFTLPEGLLVTGVSVQVGQSVKEGDPIATFDTEELARMITCKQAELQKVKVQAAQQAEGQTADPYSAQLAQEQLQRAYDETHRTYAEGQDSIERARQKREEAAQAVEDARNAPLDSNLSRQEAETQRQANVDAATAALEAAEENLYQVEKSAQAANESALAAAQSVEDTRNTALHALEKEEENLAAQNELNRADAAVSIANAAEMQAELDKLLALQQDGGQLVAPESGTLISLNLTAGEKSPAVGGLLADENADFSFLAPLSKEQTEKVSVGTILHISQGQTSGDAAIRSFTAPDADGVISALATLPDGSWSSGAATATATVQGGRQDFIVPVEAVRQSNTTGLYLLAVEEQNTILGLQNVLVGLPVTVLEEGDTTVAVSGALDYQTQIVIGSDKSIQAGDRVKINNAS